MLAGKAASTHTWLDVSVQHVLGVDVVQGGADAGHVEGDVPLLEGHLLAQVVAQVPAGLQVHRQVAVAPGQSKSDCSKDMLSAGNGDDIGFSPVPVVIGQVQRHDEWVLLHP